jgi:hypothetical protein
MRGEGGDLRGSVINLLKFNGILIFGTNVCAVFLCLMRYIWVTLFVEHSCLKFWPRSISGCCSFSCLWWLRACESQVLRFGF